MSEADKLRTPIPPLPSVKPLTGKADYSLWSARIKAYLSMHKLWLKEEPVDSDICFSLLTSCVSDALFEQSNLLGHNTAPKVWDFLKSLFLTSDLSSKSTALNNLLSFNYSGKDMHENKTALLKLKRDLKCSFEDSDSISLDDLVTLIALVNVPSQYFSLRTTLEETTTAEKPLSMDSLFNSLLREESAHVSSSFRSTSQAGVSPKSNLTKCQHKRIISKCWTCNPGSKPKECTECKAKGFRKTLHPPNSDTCRLQQLENKNHPSSTANRTLRFTVDSGSTDNLVSNIQDVQPCSSLSHPIRTANGEFMYATNSGSIQGSTFNLDKVLVCPTITENLLSVSKLDDQGLDTLFSNGQVLIGKFGSLAEVLSTGKRIGSSYYFDFPVSNTESAARSSISELHRRFNHLNPRDILKLSENNMTNDLSDIQNEPFNCESCLIGKMRKGSPPQSSSSRATRPGELLHTDICGPFEISASGKQYLLSFIDDYSRYAFVFLIQSKSEAFAKFKFIDDYMYNKFTRHISTIRSDNGKEFKNASFSEYCAVYGITQQFTTPYSSNQNGIAERLNLTIFNGVRTLLHDSELPTSLWDEAAMNMAYTRNRSPTSANTNSTPYELFHGLKPDVSHLQIFGATCFAITTPYQRRNTNSFKLADRSEKCVFVGYSNDSKSYRLLNAQNQITLSRYEDTIFTPKLSKGNSQTSQSTSLTNDTDLPNSILNPRTNSNSPQHSATISESSNNGLQTRTNNFPSSPVTRADPEETTGPSNPNNPNSNPPTISNPQYIALGTIQTRSQPSHVNSRDSNVSTSPAANPKSSQRPEIVHKTSTNIFKTQPNKSQTSSVNQTDSNFSTTHSHNSTANIETDQNTNENSFYTAECSNSENDTDSDREIFLSELGNAPISSRLIPTDQPGIFKHPTKGKVSLQPVTASASNAIDAPPSRPKRHHPPIDYSQSFAATSEGNAEEVCLASTTDCLNQSGLEWFKLPPAFARSANGNPLPVSYDSIDKLADKEEWIKATDSEIASLMEHQTWELVPLPPGRKALKNKWVFRIKRDAYGNITRYKARLCACGYNQIEGIDYKDIYSPVVRAESFRLFLGIVAARDMECIQMDVVTAFLNGSIKENVYMRQPPGYTDSKCPDKVCKIVKNLYGLKQAPKVWHDTIDPYLKTIGFSSLTADPCIYFKWNNGKLSLVSLYVDDLAIASDSVEEIAIIKEKLMKKFKMTDDGDIDYILGMEIRRNREKKEIYVSSKNKIDELLKEFNMATCIPASTPMDCMTISAADCPKANSEEWNHMQSVPYRSCVGKLTHLMRTTRPDLAFSVSVVNRYLHNPGSKHWNAVKRILRYLKGTRQYELKLAPLDMSTSLSACDRSSMKLSGNADADWGGHTDNSKSTSGYAFFLGTSLISWASKVQPQTATSSTHAEYIATYHATAECLWTRTFLKELGLLNSAMPTTLYCDNEAAIKIANYHMVTPRSKHFETKLHCVREKVQNGEISLSFCPGKENVADIFTKPLPKMKFLNFRTELGLEDSSVHVKV